MSDQIDDWCLTVVKQYLKDALDSENVSYSISISSDHSFDPFLDVATAAGNDYPHEDSDGTNHSSCMIKLKRYWEDWVSGHPDEASDFNLCLVLQDDYEDRYGIYGRAGGNAGVCRGAKRIDSETDSNFPRFDSGNYPAHVAIHEIGHMIGVSHDDGACYQLPSSGDAQTPHYSGASQNNCGYNNVNQVAMAPITMISVSGDRVPAKLSENTIKGRC
ncbi:zinc-dependent metalloprotease family protein [Haloprofundus halobius]|uniref:zinc-dependent metalloprotease family protein n=1 Tax=Haloprofundus halobius TaxID=2876194 RepID=UPI001CCE9185|nr:hypothetical protein [Haloprofundus halobius]